MAKAVKERALVLVKAYPQPSQKYEETVCCAGVTAQGEFVRIYPVRYRRLPPAKRFERWDIIEFESTHPVDDHRPESRHVNEDSITIVQRRDLMDEGQRVRLWAPHVASSLVSLREENLATGRSLGVIRPDPGSLVFSHRKLKDSAEDAAIRTLFEQVSLIEESSLPKLSVEYEFTYRFTCAGTPHEMKIHDWEVQAAYFSFKNRYGDAVLAHLKQVYQVDMPSRNPHFVMGTMKAHPRQFIVIGVLRSTIAPDDASRQGTLI